MREINEIFVHCAATRPDWMAGESVEAKRDEIDRWHRERGFDGFGYHFLIDRDGKIARGRPLSRAGAHARGHNAKSVGICLVGGFGSDAGDQFARHYTHPQEVALRALLDTLREEFPNARVRGHNEVANKACPGFNVSEWLTGDTRKAVAAPAAVRTTDRASAAQSTTVQASVVQIASSAGAGIAAVGALDGWAQIAVIGFAGLVIMLAIWILRERLQKWAEGVR